MLPKPDLSIAGDLPITLNWQQALPCLPNIKQTPHIGLAGAFSGVFNGNGDNRHTIVLAGGTNFPNTSLLDAVKSGNTPEKVYHNEILLFSIPTGANSDQGQWRVSKAKLPQKIAHGVSINTQDGVLVFGGETQDNQGTVSPSDCVYKLYLINDEIKIKKLHNMPVSFCYGSVCRLENTLYLCGGIQNGVPSNQVWRYDIEHAAWTRLSDYPGPARTELISTIGIDQYGQHYLYLFSGVANKDNMIQADVAGVKLKLSESSSSESKSWQFTADIIPQGQTDAMSLLGASHVQLSQQYTLCFGGYNKTVFNHFVEQLKQSQSKEHTQNIKIDFFSQAPEQFQWNKQAIVFDSIKNTWLSLGELPFWPNCGGAAEVIEQDVVLLSGEIKPGVRTPSVNIARLE